MVLKILQDESLLLTFPEVLSLLLLILKVVFDVFVVRLPLDQQLVDHLEQEVYTEDGSLIKGLVDRHFAHIERDLAIAVHEEEEFGVLLDDEFSQVEVCPVDGPMQGGVGFAAQLAILDIDDLFSHVISLLMFQGE